MLVLLNGNQYNSVAEGEDVTGATTTIDGTSGATSQHEHMEVQLDTGVLGTVAHDHLGMILRRSGGTCAVDVDLIEVHFEILMNKLGEPT